MEQGIAMYRSVALFSLLVLGACHSGSILGGGDAFDSSESAQDADSSFDSGPGNSDGACSSSRSAFVDKVVSSTSCSADTDCIQYTALCLQVESNNCAGIFYVSKADQSVIDGLAADYESCTGMPCAAGGTCLLGGLPPICSNGKCLGQWR